MPKGMKYKNANSSPRGGGKVAKAAKSSGGGGRSLAGDYGTATAGGTGLRSPEYGSNARVRETRLPAGGCPRGSKTPNFKKRMKSGY